MQRLVSTFFNSLADKQLESETCEIKLPVSKDVTGGVLVFSGCADVTLIQTSGV